MKIKGQVLLLIVGLVSWNICLSLLFFDRKNNVDSSFFTNILLHINIGEFVTGHIGVNCPKDHVIDAEDICKDAAYALGMPYKRAVKHEFKPAGCFFRYSSPPFSAVYFNVITDPSQTIPEQFGARGGICRITSKSQTYY